MTDNDKSAFGFDNSTRGSIDRANDALDGRDDPTRGPVDRAENASSGHDDPNRGPLDRAANAITGGSGGIAAAMGHDGPNRGPLDRTANAVTGGSGGTAAATGDVGQSDRFGSSTISAVFDSRADAERAVSELRQSGVPDSALSVIATTGGTTTTQAGDGEITDEQHENVARGILGGGALGAGLGVLALAIPGVGPLVAAGAIAASAVPGAMALGAAAGVAAGTFNETLKGHGVSDEDAAYYGDRMKDGGVLVTVQAGGMDSDQTREVLFRNGGHSSARTRTAAL